jgi:thiol-disulfide isomerase/thioredoxin
MGRAERNQSARERIAAQQSAARRAEAQRRALIATGSVLAVIVVVVVLIVVKANSKSASAATKISTAPVTDTTVAQQIASVPASAFNAVGAGPNSGQDAVDPLTPVKGTLLTSGGKPEMLYVGAEYCPYCAAERWAMAVALSRFGTFTGLHFIHSHSTDVYSNTPTLTFYKSTYTSNYLVFTPVETTTVTATPLQSPTSAQVALMNLYDAPPYVPSGDSGSFPFVDIGNRYISDGAEYLPSVLGSSPNPDPSHFGLTWAQVGADLSNPSSQVAQDILGTANHITAAICKITNGQPGSVCDSPAVQAVASQI